MNQIMRNKIYSSAQSGSTLVEFAVAASLFFMLLLGAALWGMTMWQVNTLQYAVERGARCSIIGYADSTCQAQAVQNAPGLGSPSQIVSSNSFTVTSAQTNSFGTGQNAGIFFTACVSTSGVGSIAGAVALIRSNLLLKSITYCRPAQG